MQGTQRSKLQFPPPLRKSSWHLQDELCWVNEPWRVKIILHIFNIFLRKDLSLIARYLPCTCCNCIVQIHQWQCPTLGGGLPSMLAQSAKHCKCKTALMSQFWKRKWHIFFVSKKSPLLHCLPRDFLPLWSASIADKCKNSLKNAKRIFWNPQTHP